MLNFFLNLLVFLILLTGETYAKSVHPWKESTRKNLIKRPYSKNLPQKKLYDLNLNSLTDILSISPKRFSKLKSEMIISLPNGDGGYDSFRVYDSPVMHDKLAAKYPRIKSYYGQGVENSKARAYFSNTPLGFKGMIVYADKPAVFVEPISADQLTYTVYKSAENPTTAKFTETDYEFIPEVSTDVGVESFGANEGKLRIYKLAVATTGEFAALYGGNKEMTLAGVANSLTRINAVLENDFGIRVELPFNNDAIIYTDAVSDPYGSTSTNWSAELQANVNSVLGRENFDFGHLLASRDAGGGAGQGGGRPCATNNAAAYSIASPTSYDDERFNIRLFAHEVGHQLGASHTFLGSGYGSAGGMEIGVGSTIMSYAGSGAQPAYQGTVDPYYHAMSIEQVTEYHKTLDCGTTILTGNSVPVANGGPDYIIPKSTPFMLKGSATDADLGDSLTYNWENIDAGDRSVGTPSSTQTYGPVFRSYPPSALPFRYFPNMTTVLAGKLVTMAGTLLSASGMPTEILPEVSRTLNFRFTVRDNSVLGGSNSSDDVIVNVNAAAGPFKINSQNSLIGYQVGSTQLVQWAVAGTDSNGINCSAVDILLSTDGGKTFPITLLSGTPNDGSESIVIPNIPGDKNRIMVRGRNHIFFDVNDANFSIYVTPDSIAPSAPTNFVATYAGSTVANLSWTASTDNVGVVAYDIYQDGVLVASVTGTSHMVTTLKAEIDNIFYVKARDLAGNVSVASNTSITQAYYTADQTPPTAPSLTASKINSISAYLSWSGATDNQGVTNYEIYQNGLLVRTIGNEPGVYMMNLLPASNYQFYVKAKDSSGNKSPASNTVSVTTPARSTDSTAPTAPILSASGVTASSVILSWSGATDNVAVSGYEIYQNGIFKLTITGTNINLGGLNALTSYNFYIRARDAAGNKSPVSNTISVTTKADTIPPTAPILKISTVFPDRIDLTFSGMTDNVRVTSFDIYMNGSLRTTSAWNSVYITGLMEQTTYSFYVIAKDAAGNSSPASNTISATTKLADRIRPTTPTNFVVSRNLWNANYTWDASTDDSGSVTYSLMTSEGGIYYGMRQTTLTSTSSSLLPATTYTMYVSARDPSYNNSDPSNSVTFTTPGSDVSAPNTPRLSAVGTTSVSTNLVWDTFGDNVGVTGYEVYQNDVLIYSIAETSLTSSLRLTNLSPSTAYRFNVLALDAAGNKGLSNQVSMTTLASTGDTTSPTAPVVQGNTSLFGSSASVLLNWSGATDNVGVVAYDVYQDGKYINSTTNTTFGIIYLKPLTNYSFYVIAKDAANNKSPQSILFNITTASYLNDSTPPTAPSLSASQTSSYSTTLSWSGATDNVGVVMYDIYQNGVALKNSVYSTKLTLLSLSAGRSYSFSIVAIDQAGNRSPASNIINVSTPASTDTTPPTAPILSLGYVNPTDLHIYFKNSTDNVGVYEYEIYLNGVLKRSSIYEDMRIDGLSAGTSYNIYVIAKDQAGNRSAASNTLIVNTTSSGNDTTPPTASVLSSSGTTASSTNLSWTASTDNVGVVGYDVYQNGAFKTSVSGTSLSVSGLSASTTYSFYVRAKDAAGNVSSASNTVSVTTLATGDTTAPTAPSLASSGLTSSSVNLSWSGATDNVGVVGYDVYQNGSLRSSVSGTSLAVSGLSASTNYSFYVKAKDAAGNISPSSNVVNVTTLAPADTIAPSAPTLASSGLTSSSVNLSWSGASDNVGVVGYDVYQNGSLKSSVSGTSLAVSGLTPSTAYSFHVIAKDAAGNRSVASNTVSVTTLVAAVSDLAVDLILPASAAKRTTVQFSATATSSAGINRVEFYVKGSRVCSDTTAPYTCSWKAPGKATTYSVEARAFDNDGNQKSSIKSLMVQ